MLKIVEEQKTGCEYKLVATLDGEYAGELEYTLFVFDTKTSVISDLRVLEKFRKKGIATELLSVAIERIFRRPYIFNIMLQDGSDGKITGRIVKKLGFEKDGKGWNVWRLTKQACSSIG